MAATDVTQTGDRYCRSCGHGESQECQCSCCPAEYEADADFAEMLDRLGAEYLSRGDAEACGWLWDAADWHQAPTEPRATARMLALDAALARNGAAQ